MHELTCLNGPFDFQTMLRTPAFFDRLYRHFKNPIRKYINRSVRNEDIAEELTQEIFFKAFRHHESYQPELKFSTWLWSIAKNTLIDWKRKNHSASANSFYHHETSETFDVEQIPCKAASAEKILIEGQGKAEILAMTEKLTEMQKKVLFMRLVEQLSYSEICRNLNLTLSAAKCLFHRAKNTLSLNARENRQLD